MLVTPVLRPRVVRARAASTLVVALLLLAVVPGRVLSAQDPPPAFGGAPTPGVRWSGARGITESVATIMARQEARDSQVGPPFILDKPALHLPEKAQGDPDSAAVSRWPIDLALAASGLPGPRLPQPVAVDFLGISGGLFSTESGAVPPDSMGGVGPTQVVVASNGRIKVFDKNGVLGPLNVADDVFWVSVRNGDPVTDPRVRYDRLSGRWFLTIINIPTDISGNPQGPNRILIAVSSTSTITNASSFSFFAFQQDVPPPAGVDLNGFADYDTLAVDRFAVYIGANIFSQDTSTFVGSSAWVVNKADLLTGTLTVTAFRQLATGTGAGCTTPQGATNDDPGATEGYFVGVDGATSGRLVLRRVSTPGGTPSISGNLNLSVPTTRAPIGVFARDVPTLPLDGLDDRLSVANVRRNKLTGTSSLCTAHNIEVDATGVAAAGGRNGSRWYEVGSLTTTPTLLQAGTLFDSTATNPRSYWIPSANMSGQGHMALGTTFASVNDYAGVAVAGRLAGDPPGSTAAPTIAEAGLFAYDDLISSLLGLPSQRWGDYSQTVVDPNDDMTFWTFQEYSAVDDFGGWGVRATQLRAPPPASPSAASPPTIAAGQAAVSVTVTGTSTSGSGFFDPGPDTGGPGFANHIAASVSGGVTVNSLTFTSPTQLTLSLDTTAATAGLKTVAITNPDGQSANGAILTVSGVTPTGAVLTGTKTVTGTFVPGGAITYTIILTNGGTGAQVDNAGNELTDVLPAASLTLVSANASSGTATATLATNTVTWNGALAVSGNVTITIQATIKGTVSGGTLVSNQGSISYDSDGNATNDASAQTDDPVVAGANNPTVFAVRGAFFTVTPCRIVDTRTTPNGPLAGPALVAGASRSFTLAGSCGVPATAKAVSLNVTVTQPTGAGDLRLYPAGQSAPLVSTINWVGGQTRANNGVAALSAAGGLAVQCDQASGTVHLILDVNGYFQ
jgi:hypothetical protein